MEKKINIFIMALIFIFTIGTVKAEELAPYESACPSSSKADLLAAASKVQVTYEPVEFKPEGFDDENSENYSTIYYYMDLKIHNLPEKLYISVSSDQPGSKSFDVSFDNINPNGEIVLRHKNTSQIVNFTFDVKGNTYDCFGQTLRTIKVSVPKYNAYSSREVCMDIPDYYLCQQYISFDVDSANFLDNVNNYKKKLEAGDTTTNDKTNKGVLSKTVSTISKYKFPIVGLIIVIGCVVTVLIIKKKRSSVL